MKIEIEVKSGTARAIDANGFSVDLVRAEKTRCGALIITVAADLDAVSQTVIDDLVKQGVVVFVDRKPTPVLWRER